jgi:hypothetical protein
MLSVWRVYSDYDREIDEYRTVGDMRIGKTNRSSRRVTVTVSLCLLQIYNDLTCNRTRTAAVGSAKVCLSYGMDPISSGETNERSSV